MDPISEQFHSILFLEDRFNLLPKLKQNFFQYSEDHSKDLIKYLKAVIKSKKNPPTVKLQALKVIESLMSSKNPYIIDFCGKKFYNRFKIFAEFRKESTDLHRGAQLFQAEARFQQIASEDFFILLLQCIKSWATEHSLDSRGKPSYYVKMFNYLTSKGVTFPDNLNTKEKEELKNSLIKIRKNVKLMLEYISECRNNEKIKRIGETLKNSNLMIQNQIVKYMDMEDHDLIKDLNLTLDLLNDGKNAFRAWKERTSRVSFLDSPLFSLPPTCLFLKDIEPKLLPVPDELSESIQEIQFDEFSPAAITTDREMENEKEFTMSCEWTGLGADYCRLKDKLDLTEQNALSYQMELEKYTLMYIEEAQIRETLEYQVESLQSNMFRMTQDNSEKLVMVNNENLVLKEINKNSNEKIKELESKICKHEEEIAKLRQVNENLELNNANLVSNCKSLEEEVEKFAENEKFLKKEIKELFKKINKPKNERDSSSNSETLMHNEESPTKNLRFSLISRPEDELFNTGPLSCEDIQSEMTEDEHSMESVKFDGFINAHEPTDKLTHIDNFENFKDLIKKRSGVLYECPLLKITYMSRVSGFQGRAKLLIENTSGQMLSSLKTKLYSDPRDGILIKIDSEKFESLPNSETLTKTIIFECRSIFQTFPLMKLSYILGMEKKTISLLIPISYTLFCEKGEIDLITEWESIEECIETIVKTDFSSVKKLAKSLLFSKNFNYSYIEGNGTIIASKSPVGIVLAVVTLKDSQANIQVKCKNLKVRDLISSMIVTQILPSLS